MTSHHSLVVRLPSGREYWYAHAVPAVGEMVVHFGTRYVVVASEPGEDDRVVVTLAEEEMSGDPVAAEGAL